MKFFRGRLAACSVLLILVATLSMAAARPARADVLPPSQFHQSQLHQTQPHQNHFHRGIQAYRQGRYPDALDAFTQVIQQEDVPTSRRAAAYGNRCLVDLELQTYQRAIADCTQGLQLGLTGTEAYLNRGLAHYRLGDYAAALADYNHSLAALPEDYRVLYNRGLAQAGLGHYHQALKDYRRSLRLSPNLPPERLARIYLDQGLAHLQLEQDDSAILDFSQAIAYNGASVEAYVSRAYVAHRRGEDAAELTDLTQALVLDPTHARTHFNLGMLHYQQGHIVGAIASFEQAAHHFWLQNSLEDYRQVIQILQQLQPPTALA